MAEPTTGTDTITDDEVVAYLTELVSPIEWWCVLDWHISFWSEKSRMVLSLRCRSDSLARACRRYLTTRGWVYQTMSDLNQHAVQFGWPGWSAK